MIDPTDLPLSHPDRIPSDEPNPYKLGCVGYAEFMNLMAQLCTCSESDTETRGEPA